MKHQQAPKFLLTTALLAVLGANYGFQASSLSLHKDTGTFELSSETSSGRPLERIANKTPTETTVEATATASAPAPLETAEKNDLTKSKTIKFEISGASVEGQCSDAACKSAVLEASKIEAFAKALISATKKSTETAPTALPVATAATKADVASEYDCDFSEDGQETRAQKRDRLRCEKQEKERLKREDRIAKFEDKMESIKDRCEDSDSESKLECLSSEFNQALSRYSGRNAIPTHVVQRYFKNVVGSELSKMLFNSDVNPQQAMSQLQDIFDGLPAEYGVIRQNILSAIQTETKNRSQSINQQYKLAETLKNKPQEYLQTVGEAQQAQAELAQMADVYSAAARTSDSFTGDVSFAKYYQMNYMPSMRQLFATMGPSGSTGTTQPVTTEENSRMNTRGAATTAVPTTNKIDAGAPTPWEFLNNSGGVRTGNPSNTSMGGTRGARSMGN